MVTIVFYVQQIIHVYIKSDIILHLVPFVVPAQNQDIHLAITALT